MEDAVMEGYELITDFNIFATVEEQPAEIVPDKKGKKKILISLMILTVMAILLASVCFCVRAQSVMAKTAQSDEDVLLDESVYSAKFEACGELDCWRGWTEETADADADFNIRNDSISVMINDGGSEDWHVQLISPKIDLKAGCKYSVSIKFDPEDSGNIYLPVRVQESSGEYGTIIEKEINIGKLKEKAAKKGSTEAEYIFSFTPDKDFDDAVITVDMGDCGTSQLKITDFKISEK